MSAGHLLRASALLFALVLVLGAAQAVRADSLVTGTETWNMVGAPSMTNAGGQSVGDTMWSNNGSVAVTAIVIIVVRNASNQTVYYSPATLTLSPGQIGGAQDIIFGLANGEYTATFFAFTFAGVPISTSTTVPLTLPI